MKTKLRVCDGGGGGGGSGQGRWQESKGRGGGHTGGKLKNSLCRGHLTPERRVKQSSTTIYTGKHKSFGLNVRFRITEMKRFINVYICRGYALFPFSILLLLFLLLISMGLFK